WGINYWTDVWSSNSKNAWTGRINNHRWAFAVFGIDFEPELVEFFTGVQEGAEGYGKARAQTRDLLQVLSANLPKQDLKTLRAASRNGQLSPEVLTVLTEVSQNPDLQSTIDWAGALARDPSTDPATAQRQEALAGIAQATLLYLMAP